MGRWLGECQPYIHPVVECVTQSVHVRIKGSPFWSTAPRLRTTLYLVPYLVSSSSRLMHRDMHDLLPGRVRSCNDVTCFTSCQRLRSFTKSGQYPSQRGSNWVSSDGYFSHLALLRCSLYCRTPWLHASYACLIVMLVLKCLSLCLDGTCHNAPGVL